MQAHSPGAFNIIPSESECNLFFSHVIKLVYFLRCGRCLMMELSSAFVNGADEDFIIIMFDYIKPHLQV